MKFEAFQYCVKDMVILTNDVLRHILGDTPSARNLLHRWAKEGRLIRLKRGFYVLAERYRRPQSFLSFVIANRLSSPSTISLDSALAYHGMIPERVVEITSVSLKRTKDFVNPFGRFTYRKLSRGAYSQGIIIEGSETERFLIADREKALLDKIYFSHAQRHFHISYLIDSLRIEEEDILRLNFDRLTEYAAHYPTKKMKQVVTTMRRHYGT